MTTILGFILSLLLTAVALLHIYWAFGGTWGVVAAIPEKDGTPLFKPGFIGTMAVAGALLAMTYLILGVVGFYTIPFLNIQYVRRFILICAGLFIVRAIGDFNYVGFTKKIKDTPFGFWDTRLHSPLFLLIALIFTVIGLS